MRQASRVYDRLPLTRPLRGDAELEPRSRGEANARLSERAARYAALRLETRNSPIRSSAFKIFSVEFAYDTRT